MAPKQKTKWQLYKSNDDLSNSAMASWVAENNSLMKRLNDEKQEIVLNVLSEEICTHSDIELDLIGITGNLRKIVLTGSTNIVFAETFFSNHVIEKFSKFGKLGDEPLGKFLFSNPNITKHETYVATYSLDNQDYQGRKCIYDFDGSKFSVIEVFLFND